MSFGAVGLSNVYNCKHLDVTTTSSISSIIPVYSQICETVGRIFLVAWQWIDWLSELTHWHCIFCYRLVTTSHTARRKFARQRGIRCWHTTSPMPSFCVQYLGHVQLPRRMLEYATVDGAYHPLPWNRVYSSITYCINYTLFFGATSVHFNHLHHQISACQRPLKVAEKACKNKVITYEVIALSSMYKDDLFRPF